MMQSKNIKVDKRSFIRWKVYVDRSRMYIGYIQFFLIGIVFLESFKDKQWGKFIFQHALISIPVFLLLFVLLSLILGYFDSKLGFREEELRNLSKSNPVMMEMLDQLREMNEKIDQLKNK